MKLNKNEKKLSAYNLIQKLHFPKCNLFCDYCNMHRCFYIQGLLGYLTGMSNITI